MLIRPGHPSRTESGFTLIEVVIALAIIAIGLTAVVAIAARSGRVDASLQQRTFAAWVATNRMTRLRTDSHWPDLGTQDGKVKLADQKWHWKATVKKTQDPDLRRVTIDVSTADKPDDSVTELIGFIGKPLPKPKNGPMSGNGNLKHPDKGKGGG
ncbi:MAG TPA: type II secretion system minor pseudopilin GspI [Gammaproteobacteria bacterium]|nr:type II secretion system minor pseudopilin GspI [Gammaproteobacteria bacterium]